MERILKPSILHLSALFVCVCNCAVLSSLLPCWDTAGDGWALPTCQEPSKGITWAQAVGDLLSHAV